MHTIVDIMLFVAGFAASWFCKDHILRAVAGADALIKVIEDRLAALRSKV